MKQKRNFNCDTEHLSGSVPLTVGSCKKIAIYEGRKQGDSERTSAIFVILISKQPTIFGFGGRPFNDQLLHRHKATNGLGCYALFLSECVHS